MPSLVEQLRRGPLRPILQAVSWHRRLVAAGLAALATLVGLSALKPSPPPTSNVVTIARDLPAGTRLTPSDVRVVALPAGVVPSGSLRATSGATGRVLATPARRGEPLTDVRLLGPGLAAAYGPGRVIVPIRLADAGVLELVQIGTRVDVLAAETTPDQAYASARTLVRSARIVALPAREPEPSGPLAATPLDSGDGGLVLLAVPPSAAPTLARAAVTARLSVVIRE
ncbi:CpaB family protein [Flindersiella endophytica]